MALSLSSPRVAASACLRIRREDLRFGPLPDGRVLLEVTVHNDGDATSAPEIARVSFAPFGAFVPGAPVGVMQVPPIPPRGRTTMRQAFAGLDGRNPQTGSLLGLLGRTAGSGAHLAFAGNFDVFVRPGVAAERHCAAVVRCTPSVRNLAFFLVGHGQDAYRFSRTPDSSEWPVELASSGRHSLPWGEWQSVLGTTPHTLIFQPPEFDESGFLGVAVTQSSTMRQAIVEFSLSISAAAPACMEIG